MSLAKERRLSKKSFSPKSTLCFESLAGLFGTGFKPLSYASFTSSISSFANRPTATTINKKYLITISLF